MKYADVHELVNNIDGWMGSIRQREFMFELAKKSSYAAEIGTYKGLSASVVGLGMKNGDCKCRNCGFKGKYYCIDNYEATNKELVGTPQGVPTLEEFQHNINTLGLNDILIPIVGYSYDPKVWEQIPNDLDFVYIDGDHQTSSVFTDTVLYIHKLKKDGLILYHDHRNPDFIDINNAIDYAVQLKFIEMVEEFDDFGVYRPLFSEKFD